MNFRTLLCLTTLLLLPGCVVMTAVSAVPGALYEAVANQFGGKEKSFPYSMAQTLGAVQKTLWHMQLDTDIVEIQEDGGYGIGFGNENLEGTVTLRQQTNKLTTIYIRVKSNVREESVENAIIQQIGELLDKAAWRNHFSTRNYHNLRAKPTTHSERVGWYRPGAELDVAKSQTDGWLRVKLPSGKNAFLKGSIAEINSVNRLKKINSQKEN